MKSKWLTAAAITVALLIALAFEAGVWIASNRPQAAFPARAAAPAQKERAWAVGVVTDPSGRPIANAAVTLQSADATTTVTSDAAGQFAADLAPGRYKVSAQALGQAISGRVIDVTAAEPSRLALTIPLASLLSADVITADASKQTAHRQVPPRHSGVGSKDAAAPPQTASLSAPSVRPVIAPPEPETPVLNVPPTPMADSEENVEPAVAVNNDEKCPDPDRPCRVEVFYATDRAKITGMRRDKRTRGHQVAFSGGRSRNGITYGWCDVTIPRMHEPMTGRLDYAGTYDVKTSVFIHDVVEAEQNVFLARLANRVNQDPAKEMLVFIHGYNISFFEAARRTAQMHYDLGFKGAPVFFSWPSRGNVLSYLADEASSEWAAEHLRDFLDLLAARSGATRIHLIAHSMGNRPLTRALADIGRREHDLKACELAPANMHRAKFSQVIMAAPDLDKDMFLQLKDAVQLSADRLTIYASARDRAVLGSRFLHRFTRLGTPKGEPSYGPNVEAIDATAASTDFLGHSYYGSSILWDVQFVLRKPAEKAVERCTIQKAEAPSAYPKFVPQIEPRQKPGRFTRAYLKISRRRKPELIEQSCKVGVAALHLQTADRTAGSQ